MFPVLLTTPWFRVYSYGFLLAVGYTVGVLWILYEAGKEKLPRETLFDMLLLQLVVAVCSARFLFLLEYQPHNLNLRGFLAFESGGLTFYGGVIGAFTFDFLYLKWAGLPFWKAMDCVGFGLPLGVAITRLGCFLNGCCHGVECSWPWGVVFPFVGQQALHPTQLYESFGALCIFGILQVFRDRRRNYGEGFMGCMGLYGGFRFLVEFWRGDNPVVAFGLHLSQLIGLGMIVATWYSFKLFARTPDLRIMPPAPAPVEESPAA